MVKNLLFIGGKANSGKDVVANYLIGKTTNHYSKLAFADSLKEFCSEKYNIPKYLFYTQLGKQSLYNKNISLRDILIKEAALKRYENEDYWIKQVAIKINNSKHNNIIISDFRYPNEYYNLRKYLNFKVSIKTIQVIRDLSYNIDDPSENSLNDFKFDIILKNNESYKDLYNKIDLFIN